MILSIIMLSLLKEEGFMCNKSFFNYLKLLYLKLQKGGENDGEKENDF